MSLRFFPPALFVLLFILSAETATHAQNKLSPVIDSLEKQLAKAAQDTNRIKTLNLLSFEYSSRDTDKGLAFGNEALALSQSLKWKKGEALSITNIGRNYWRKGDFKNAISKHEAALALWTALNRKDKIATLNMYLGQDYANSGDYSKALYYLGVAEQGFRNVNMPRYLGIVLGIKAWVYQNMGMYPEARQNELNGLKAYEEAHDTLGMSIAYSNLAEQYLNQKDYHKALEVYLKCVIVLEKNHDQINLAQMYMDIGTCYKQLDREAECMKNLNIALEYGNNIKDYNVIADVLMRMADVYANRADKKQCISYLLQAAAHYENTHNMHGMLSAYDMLGLCHIQLKKNKDAAAWFEKSRQLLSTLPSLSDRKEYYESMIQLDSATGNWKSAFEHYKKYVSTRDSMFNEENTKKMVQAQMMYSFEKKEATNRAEQEKKESEILKQQAELKAKRNQQYALFGGLALVLIFAVVIYKRFKVSQRQNLIIEEQKKLVEEKNREIVDSITYARRIQSAILPSHKAIKEFFPESFILYMPKDIVAGDFYWLHQENDCVFLAVADCTGHGVPGAMVSVVCNNALQRSVREFGLTDPGKILDCTRNLVITEFEKSADAEEVKDGMDISLLVHNKKTGTFSWAGANNPLWLIKKDGSFEEIKGDKQPIGKFGEHRSFTTHSLPLSSGDNLYLFTDGYKDQFGGPRKKKFKAAQMKEMMLTARHQGMTQQGEIYLQRMQQWMQGVEQVDDVTVLGVRV